MSAFQADSAETARFLAVPLVGPAAMGLLGMALLGRSMKPRFDEHLHWNRQRVESVQPADADADAIQQGYDDLEHALEEYEDQRDSDAAATENMEEDQFTLPDSSFSWLASPSSWASTVTGLVPEAVTSYFGEKPKRRRKKNRKSDSADSWWNFWRSDNKRGKIRKTQNEGWLEWLGLAGE